jgi:hypothetical protein
MILAYVKTISNISGTFLVLTVPGPVTELHKPLDESVHNTVCWEPLGEREQGHSGTIMVVMTQDSCGHVKNAIPKQRSKKHMGISQQGKKKSSNYSGCAATSHSLICRTHCARSSVFITLPLTLTDGFGFTIFPIGYLEKVAHGIRGTLEQGE